MMVLYIKNMVSNTCKMVVRYELEKLGLHCALIEFGKITTEETPTAGQLEKIKIALLQFGLELMDSKKSVLVEKIKSAVLEMLDQTDIQLKTNFSYYLSSKLNFDYTYLANVFSEELGLTIEHFIIEHKIQRVKELIAHGELNLTEISWKLNYSSVAHLSTQFKKITGITPSDYKHLERKNCLAFQNV